jgi:hypothetical protein
MVAFDLIELDGNDVRRSPIASACSPSWCASGVQVL